jgi:hypothetical protein
MYSKIISSPSSLEFTFRLNGSISQNLTINIPFSILNLTLTAPLVDQPTPYFPCQASKTPAYYLGRAFCQGAFIGVNWMESTSHNGVWWLAQAPGPNTPSVPTEVYIQEFDRSINCSTNNWLDSWKDSWTPIGSIAGNASGTSNTTTPAASSSGAGLSVAAIAVIGTSVTVPVLAVVLVAFLIRRRQRRDPPPHQVRKSGNEFSWHDGKGSAGFGPREMEGRETREPAELDPRRVLKGRMSRNCYELGDTQCPAELQG